VRYVSATRIEADLRQPLEDGSRIKRKNSPVRLLQCRQDMMVPVKFQAIIVIHAPTAGVVGISDWLSENSLRLGHDDRVYIGKLRPRPSISSWWRELQALDWTGVVWRIVGDGEVVEEVVLGVGSIASIGFDEAGWIVPEAEEETGITLFAEGIGAVGFVNWTAWTSWCSLGEGE